MLVSTTRLTKSKYSYDDVYELEINNTIVKLKKTELTRLAGLLCSVEKADSMTITLEEVE